MSNAGTPTDAVAAVTDDSSWQDHLTAVAVAAVGGAILITGILYLAGALAGDTGDEPPIRVKNGSLELYLLSNNKEWKERTSGDEKHWRISGGTRGDDPLDVDISVKSGATCSSQSGTGGKVTVYYSDGSKVVVESHGRHTWVDSDPDLTLSTNKRMLSYSPTGYISRIDLDTTTMCTFADRTQLATLLISDY